MFCFRIRLQPWGAGEDELMVEYKGIRQAAQEKAECKVKLWWPTPTSDRLGCVAVLGNCGGISAQFGWRRGVDLTNDNSCYVKFLASQFQKSRDPLYVA